MVDLTKAFILSLVVASVSLAQKPKSVPVAPVTTPAPVVAAPVATDSLAAVLTVRLPELTDSLLDAKLDSLSRLTEKSDLTWDSTEIQDSTAKLQKAVQQGKYIDRSSYDKSNFDHWKVDSALQANQKARLVGDWRTDILEHGHAFRDASVKFGKNDTLFSTTYTYADSARYLKTGEYAYKARYRFESDSTFRSREVFPDRNVVRWDYVAYKVKGDDMTHHLYKLEFRDLMDNWLDAIQEFDRIAPEVYHRTKAAPASAAKPKSKS